jgi:hypothetical protein
LYSLLLFVDVGSSILLFFAVLVGFVTNEMFAVVTAPLLVWWDGHVLLFFGALLEPEFDESFSSVIV